MLRFGDATVGVEAALELVGLFGFERVEDALLEGLPRPVALDRVSRSASAVGF
jgi:hypothetical protein